MKQDKETINNYFKTGDKPTQEQFHNAWDSFCHKDETIAAEKIEGSPTVSKFLITSSGRTTLRTDFNWVTNATSIYGTNIFEFNEDCGGGVQPSYSWNQIGHTIPLGYKISKLIVLGRTNALDVEDVRFQFVKRIKSTTGDWQNINDDSEFLNTVLYDDLWRANTEQDVYDSYSHRKAKRVFEMDTTNDNNVFEEDGELILYFKPSGTYTVDRNFMFSLTIELEKIQLNQ